MEFAAIPKERLLGYIRQKIDECPEVRALCGIPDEEWGGKVAATQPCLEASPVPFKATVIETPTLVTLS